MRLPVFLAEDGLVTDAQVRRLREKRMSGKTLAAAAAAAGMSERTARQWQSGALPSTAKAPRTWRTREDPFAEVWESEVVPHLVADTDGRLQVLALFKALCRRHPGRFQPGQLRTLQRRVRDWRVQSGADREVSFEQVAVPGREAAFDFTDGSDLGVTLWGVPFPHLLFEWVLSYSKWTYVALAVSETFEALVAGLRGALWTLGAVPAVLRHDNLSAATHKLKRSGGRQLTARFQQVMDHYGLRSSRIQPETARERGGRAGAPPDEDGHRAGVAVTRRQRLRRRVGVSGLRACGRRRGAEPAGGVSAGRGAFVLVVGVPVLREPSDGAAPAARRRVGGAASGPSSDAPDGPGGDLPEAPYERRAAGTPRLPVPAARADDRPSGSGWMRGHHVHPGDDRLSVPGRDHGLGQPTCAVVAAVEHDGQQLLRRGAGGGAADGDARHLQHRPGVAVYERGVHRPCPGCGRAVLDCLTPRFSPRERAACGLDYQWSVARIEFAG